MVFFMVFNVGLMLCSGCYMLIYLKWCLQCRVCVLFSYSGVLFGCNCVGVGYRCSMQCLLWCVFVCIISSVLMWVFSVVGSIGSLLVLVFLFSISSVCCQLVCFCCFQLCVFSCVCSGVSGLVICMFSGQCWLLLNLLWCVGSVVQLCCYQVCVFIVCGVGKVGLKCFSFIGILCGVYYIVVMVKMLQNSYVIGFIQNEWLKWWWQVMFSISSQNVLNNMLLIMLFS